MEGVKHLVECSCVLPQLRRLDSPPYHSFVAFSIIDDSGSVIEKRATCPNCRKTHRVYEIGKSDILTSADSSAVMKESDISLMLPSELVGVLTSYKCDIATWEQVHFIVSNARWGETVVVTREETDGNVVGKLLTIEQLNKFKLEPITFTDNVQ